MTNVLNYRLKVQKIDVAKVRRFFNGFIFQMLICFGS
jgi:hypothetical protein